MNGSSEVTILIKAPNQMVEDQSVLCERNWTIKELKIHLSNVYPSKPHPEGQKLIYSGKLLADGAVLSDVLKTYDGHENNTIHLVCSTKENPWVSNIVTESTNKPVNNSAPEAVPSNPWPAGSNYGEPSNYPTFTDNVNPEVRRRYPAPFPGPVNNVPYAYNYYSQENMNRHIMWVQQAYMQYMAQYMQTSNGRFLVRPTNEEQQEVQPPPNEPPPQNAAEEEHEEENHVNRDWLEWIYIMSRLIVLSSVVYFYSSPLRFMLVMTVALILFSIDLERWRRRNNVNEAQDNVNSNADDRSNDVNNIQERPHWLAIVWTFLSSFFLSLIPDQRDIP